MNHTLASCGHYVLAIGSPGSGAREKCERMPCDRCRCPACGGEGEFDTGGFEPWGTPISVGCEDCLGSGEREENGK